MTGGARRLALASIGLAALCAATSTATSAAPASVLDLPETPAQLELGAGWTEVEPPSFDGSGLGAAELGPTRLVTAVRRAARGPRAPALTLIVLRFDSPNPAAWRKSTRSDYLDRVEADLGLGCPPRGGDSPASCRGFERTKRRDLELAGVPAMDLQARADGGRLLMFRFLFFRTYTLVAAIEVPARSRDGAAARKLVASFAPPANWKR